MTVVVGVDGSERSQQALAWALERPALTAPQSVVEEGNAANVRGKR